MLPWEDLGCLLFTGVQFIILLLRNLDGIPWSRSRISPVSGLQWVDQGRKKLIIGGYLWFLYHNRDVSYKSVFQQTTTRRQRLLYEQRGFDEEQWAELVSDSKRLGREIKEIGEQYGVRWNPKVEAHGRAEKILEKEERKDRKRKDAQSKDKEDDDD